ncbi:MAG: response regulator transcription factor [Lachnospiraceae bacterium]|nr:response regulator transcription factor [Lachnospiraceae bacterium]MDO5551325.1 response regulator transcription factor [Lachnospiraceae bacterium]
MRILVAEDEQDLNRLLVRTLEKEGYGVDACFDGEEALYYLENTEYDAAVLDIMMPKQDGLTVLRKIRSRGKELPIMFLTARDSIADRVNGLDSGADDYLVKPFDLDELLARIRTMTRKRSPHTSSVITIGDLTLDTGSHRVRRGGKQIQLSSREYAILEYLCMNPGIVLSREKIENHIWNYDYSGGSNVVDVYISYLRKKIDGGHSRKLIRTVWGSGWMIKEEI